MKNFLIWLCLVCSLSVHAFALYQPKVGDLLFQDLNCGALCNAITGVTKGYDNSYISHVGMVISAEPKVEVIEAIGDDVHVVSLQQFLDASVNKQGEPRVIVGRLMPEYQHLVPGAVKYALSKIGMPYNETFKPDNDGKTFYCSQLIYDAFKSADDGKPIFKTNKMTFEADGKILSAWKNYFHNLNVKVPEGEVGTNPGMLSRSNIIKIIYNYGGVRYNRALQK
ncbi:YiiX/YebB-like N1pC/P60 family cysteine hydrolase [Francisellaceae bacterium]|nr:YiiX/YebB-like N1pC/P60 family cysteine hydrolase [Francisellaceae bacterium]